MVSTTRRRGDVQPVNDSRDSGQTSFTKPRVERLLTVRLSLAVQSLQQLRHILHLSGALLSLASCVQCS